MMQGCALCGYIEKAKILLSKEIIREKKKSWVKPKYTGSTQKDTLKEKTKYK